MATKEKVEEEKKAKQPPRSKLVIEKPRGQVMKITLGKINQKISNFVMDEADEPSGQVATTS